MITNPNREAVPATGPRASTAPVATLPSSRGVRGHYQVLPLARLRVVPRANGRKGRETFATGPGNHQGHSGVSESLAISPYTIRSTILPRVCPPATRANASRTWPNGRTASS
jgi:hypothetical protein